MKPISPTIKGSIFFRKIKGLQGASGAMLTYVFGIVVEHMLNIEIKFGILEYNSTSSVCIKLVKLCIHNLHYIIFHNFLVVLCGTMYHTSIILLFISGFYIYGEHSCGVL